MDDVFKYLKLAFCAFTLTAVTLAPNAKAMGTDFLGDLAAPIIGPAKEKMKGVLVYIWMQPYVGYSFGSSDQSRVSVTGGTVTSANGISTGGFIYGGRGGLLLMDAVRVGIDYSIQSLKRDTLNETTTAGTYVRQSVKGKQTTIGALIGFDIPYTPVQGFVSKYFKTTVEGDEASGGEGWGGGISFVLKNPFILSLEYRKLDYASAPALSGKSANAAFTQYIATLSFMLF